MTQELIVCGLLAGFAGLISIMASAVLRNRRMRHHEPLNTGRSPARHTDRMSTQPHLETTR